MQIISRQDAALQGKKRYYTGEPCKHGHTAERQVSNTGCIECMRPKSYGLSKPNFKPWKPVSPLQVPHWFSADHGVSLHDTLQAHVDEVVVHWLCSWGKFATLRHLFPKQAEALAVGPEATDAT